MITDQLITFADEPCLSTSPSLQSAVHLLTQSRNSQVSVSVSVCNEVVCVGNAW